MPVHVQISIRDAIATTAQAKGLLANVWKNSKKRVKNTNTSTKVAKRTLTKHL